MSGEEQGIVALETWFDKIGTPTRLSQLSITEADLPATIENVCVVWHRCHLYAGCRRHHPDERAVSTICQHDSAPHLKCFQLAPIARAPVQ